MTVALGCVSPDTGDVLGLGWAAELGRGCRALKPTAVSTHDPSLVSLPSGWKGHLRRPLATGLFLI